MTQNHLNICSDAISYKNHTVRLVQHSYTLATKCYGAIQDCGTGYYIIRSAGVPGILPIHPEHKAQLVTSGHHVYLILPPNSYLKGA